jgi:post-segregation antitoxin (ccd killing protein)
MANLTVSVDDDLMAQIRAHPGINWSEAARDGIRRRLQELHVWDELLNDSKLTGDDVRQISSQIDQAMADRLRKLAK